MAVDPHAERIARDLGLRPGQVASVIELLDAGNTVPFVARYRKEATDSLDEEAIRYIEEAIARWRALDARRRTVLGTIEAQGKLTNELRDRILAADTLTALEDLYQPYKPKRRTRAQVAREKGLQELADLIVAQPHGRETPSFHAARFVCDAVPSAEEALAGARDIVAETISDHPAVRGLTRERALRWAQLRSERIDGSEDPRGTYELYYDFAVPVERIRPHQVLAVNRGESESVLRVRVSVAERDWRAAVATAFRPDPRSPMAEQLEQAIADAAARLLLPAIERDVRRHLAQAAERHAIAIFAKNLRGLLTQPPLSGRTVLGIDPGFRTGCKVAVTDATGKVLATATVFPHEPQRRRDESLAVLAALVGAHAVSVIAIGNGTASRETEQLVAELLRQDVAARYLMVSEAGASVYSASPLARAELPDLDVSMRGAVSIARRAQDPLAELVKIEPRSIGVGLYQHDVDQGELGDALGKVVESVVNQVGVDVNTASPALLAYVAGIGPGLARKVVEHRDATGPFQSRAALRAVPGVGPRSFEQSAGFLRVRGGDEPLDASAIHPESYEIARAVLRRAGLSPATSPPDRAHALEALRESPGLAAIAAELGAGEPTLRDILEQLARPGRDPRDDLPAPILRTDVLSMDDLVPGMLLLGTVRNVVDFGAFVDIGVKQDGLLHRSRTPRGTVLSVGDVIEVAVERVEADRGRIALVWPGL